MKDKKERPKIQNGNSQDFLARISDPNLFLGDTKKKKNKKKKTRANTCYFLHKLSLTYFASTSINLGLTTNFIQNSYNESISLNF